MKIRTLHLIPLLLLLCAALSGCGQLLQAAPSSFSLEDVPPFSGEPYVVLQDNQPGFSQEDLQLLWDAILNMFENDHSAARGKMAVRELIVFQHESELGNAPSYKLFDAVHVDRVEGATVPRKYSDYTVTVDEDLPAGVICQRMS